LYSKIFRGPKASELDSPCANNNGYRTQVSGYSTAV